jgi:hypothetical protein
MKIQLKIVITLASAIYCFYYFTTLGQGHFVDNVNLPIHEAGHVIFFAFGKFMTIAGGSIMQILIPIVFAIYFYTTNQKFSSGIILYWVAINFFSVGYYASDAVKMQLDLLTGDSSGHDWHNMLAMLGQLNHTAAITSTIYALGVVTVLLGIWVSCFAIWRAEGYADKEH